MIRLWLAGLLRRRTVTFAGLAGSVALAVGLIATLGVFLTSAQATMTARAVSGVAADWQVQVAPGADASAVEKAVRSYPGSRSARVVQYARVAALSSTTSGTTQTTGSAIVLGVPTDYAASFPGQLRYLAGARSGVLLAQQTASNLHAATGSRVDIQLPGGVTRSVVVDGVVDLPQANSFFQVVGAAAQSQPTAPPDNVILLPSALYDGVVAAALGAHSDLVTTQIHVRRDRSLPANPVDAFVVESAQAKNLEGTLSGAGRVGDNLGAALDAARGDASYASALFLFLGLPGVVLAGLLTLTLTRATAEGRKRDQALVRLRGGTPATVSRLVVAESVAVGVLGGAAGLVVAALFTAAVLDTSGADGSAIALWFVAAFVAGLIVVGVAMLPSALRAARRTTVHEGRSLAQERSPWWMRAGLDVLSLVLGVTIVIATTQGGYSLVLAPEGVPAVHIDYWAFLGPALLWLGGGLFVWRVAYWLLGRRRSLATIARPLTGRLSSTVASTLSRQRHVFATAIAMFALALGFAGSTAVFNATFQQQAEVDARLTNGADVTVQVPAGQAGTDRTTALAALPGVTAVSPVQHRFAYIGNDLQDLFGVDPASLPQASPLQNSWFQDTTASNALTALRQHPDAILVSAETVKDYQLRLGDTVSLRLPAHGTAVTVPFHYVGIAKEFPTAPKDSFFVANAHYVASKTSEGSISTYLIATSSPATVMSAAGAVAGSGATATSLGNARGVIGSSLTSVDLRGLTAIELTFALLLAVSAGALVFVLGFAERRRSYAIIETQGASRRQLHAMSGLEAVIVGVCGTVGGLAVTLTIGGVLTAVLSGVFDPPPDFVAIPVWLLLGVTLAAVGALAFGALIVVRKTRTPSVELLRTE